jgi:AAA domain
VTDQPRQNGPDRAPRNRLLEQIRKGAGNGGSDGGAGRGPTAGFADPVPISALARTDPAGEWLLRGFLARKTVTLLASLWKAGKTTWLAWLLKALADGGSFCGAATLPCRVLYVTEEAGSLWARRRDEVGIGDHVWCQVRPFRGKPRMADWLAFLGHLVGHAVEGRFDLVVIDTLANLGPLRDENDAGLVSEAMVPLYALGDAGAAVLLAHHIRKSDGQEATASRGSGALPAFVDTIIELRRYDAGNRHDRRRVLSCYGRYDETPDEVVVELGEGGYRELGDRDTVQARSMTEVLAELLPGAAPGLTIREIEDAWPGDTTPRRQRLLPLLTAGVERGDWRREGRGCRGTPYTFWRPAGGFDSGTFPSRESTETEFDARPNEMDFGGEEA